MSAASVCVALLGAVLLLLAADGSTTFVASASLSLVDRSKTRSGRRGGGGEGQAVRLHHDGLGGTVKRNMFGGGAQSSSPTIVEWQYTRSTDCTGSYDVVQRQNGCTTSDDGTSSALLTCTGNGLSLQHYNTSSTCSGKASASWLDEVGTCYQFGGKSWSLQSCPVLAPPPIVEWSYPDSTDCAGGATRNIVHRRHGCTTNSDGVSSSLLTCTNNGQAITVEHFNSSTTCTGKPSGYWLDSIDTCYQYKGKSWSLQSCPVLASPHLEWDYTTSSDCTGSYNVVWRAGGCKKIGETTSTMLTCTSDGLSVQLYNGSSTCSGGAPTSTWLDAFHTCYKYDDISWALQECPLPSPPEPIVEWQYTHSTDCSGSYDVVERQNGCTTSDDGTSSALLTCTGNGLSLQHYNTSSTCSGKASASWLDEVGTCYQFGGMSWSLQSCPVAKP